MVADASRTEGLSAALRAIPRLWQRPRPLVLRYVVQTLLALPLATVIAVGLVAWLRVPLMRQALDERSLDLLIEVISQPAASGLSWLALVGGALGVVVASLVAMAIWVWLQGGTLATYCAPERLSLREFGTACSRWFWTLLAINVLYGGLTLAALALTVGIGVLASRLWVPLGWTSLGIGAALTGILALWTELARATAVSKGEQNAIRAGREAARELLRWPWPYLAVGCAALAGSALLVAANVWLSRLIPIAWALPTLVVQQVLLILQHGLQLARQAGWVGLLAAGLDATKNRYAPSAGNSSA